MVRRGVVGPRSGPLFRPWRVGWQCRDSAGYRCPLYDGDVVPTDTPSSRSTRRSSHPVSQRDSVGGRVARCGAASSASSSRIPADLAHAVPAPVLDGLMLLLEQHGRLPPYGLPTLPSRSGQPAPIRISHTARNTARTPGPTGTSPKITLTNRSQVLVTIGRNGHAYGPQRAVAYTMRLSTGCPCASKSPSHVMSRRARSWVGP